MIDSEVANSNGFFKDPATRQDLTGNERRVVECSIDDNGKLIWPQVQFSDGSVGKIVFRLWTAEEKTVYKRYRQLGKERAPKAVEPVQEGGHPQVDETDEDIEYGQGGSVPAASTLEYIKSCDWHLGVWMFDGITFDLLGKKNARSYMPVARSVIPMEERRRLNIPIGGK